MKTIKLYNVRFYRDMEFSKTVGFKGRLLERSQALRVVKRLKRRGVEAFAAPMKVAA